LFNETISCEDMYRLFSGHSLQRYEKKDCVADFGRISQNSHYMYICAGFVRWLQGQNYQQWHLASTCPDLNPWDFFFWGCLKDEVYNRNSCTEEVKENISREIASGRSVGIVRSRTQTMGFNSVQFMYIYLFIVSNSDYIVLNNLVRAELYGKWSRPVVCWRPQSPVITVFGLAEIEDFFILINDVSEWGWHWNIDELGLNSFQVFTAVTVECRIFW
jgi:hypothetical protein